MDAWRELEEPWRACLELAWEAFGAGTVPVGSVVAGPDGSIVARGRNRIFDAPGHGLAGSRLAHAEVEALSQLGRSARYRDHTLYSTLEPCLLCTGAALLSTVGRIVYAAADPYGGACSLELAIPDWERRRMEVAGPVPGWPGRISAALQAAYWLRRDDEVAAAILDALGDEARRAGERVLALDAPAAELEEALPRLLDCL